VNVLPVGIESDVRDEVVMPASKEAERSILGACLLDNQLLPEAITGLRESDIYIDAHCKLYRAMAALHDAGRPIEREVR
jgi:replicative DNA helicase